MAGVPPVRWVCSRSSLCATVGLSGNTDPEGWVCQPGGGWKQGGECSSVLMDTGQPWAKGFPARKSRAAPRAPLWRSHSVRCSSAVTLGCAVVLLDTQVSGDGGGGL